jgi:hypothetical protein
MPANGPGLALPRHPLCQHARIRIGPVEVKLSRQPSHPDFRQQLLAVGLKQIPAPFPGAPAPAIRALEEKSFRQLGPDGVHIAVNTYYLLLDNFLDQLS